MTRARNATGAAPALALALLAATTMGGAAGCGPEVVVREAAFKKAAPASVAILPFQLVDDDAGPRADLKAAALREAFHRRFSSLAYLHLESEETDKRLRRAGLLDPKKLAGATPAELGKRLEVDAILRGEVLSLANLSGGVVYRQSISARLTLADARTGETLVAIEHTEADTGGVLVGSGQLVDAIRDTVDNSSDVGFVRLAERFAESAVRAFPPPPAPARVVPPRIDSVEVRAPAGRTLRAGDEIEVRVRATPGGAAFFDVGRDLAEVPLFEEAPGSYRGAYRVAHGDRAAGPVSVHVSDRFGATARSVPPGGELTIDARPPGAPQHLAATAAAAGEGGVRLEWAAGAGTKAAGWRIYTIDGHGAPALVAEVKGGETRARVPPAAAGARLLAVAGVDERGAVGPLSFVEINPGKTIAKGGTSR